MAGEHITIQILGNFKNDDLHDGDYYYANGDHFQGSFKMAL